jgi:hypothetical protein
MSSLDREIRVRCIRCHVCVSSTTAGPARPHYGLCSVVQSSERGSAVE